MNTTSHPRYLLLAILTLGLAALGCDQDGAPPKKSDNPTATVPAAKKVPMGKNVFLEIQGTRRRVLVNAEVCRRTGQLEQLMCRKRTKEHEAVLAADVDARDIHKALILCGAEPGKPVDFLNKKAPTGPTVKITLEYAEKGKTVKVAGQQWIRNIKTQKPLDVEWVFAGSIFTPDPDSKAPPFYGANDGDVICVANFETAMLDLAVFSSKDNDDLAFEAFTERIPPMETRVLVILEPIVARKKG